MYVIETYRDLIGRESFNDYYLCLYTVQGEKYVATCDIEYAKKYKYRKTAENMCEKLQYNNNSNLIYRVKEVK